MVGHRIVFSTVTCGGCGWLMESTDACRWRCLNGNCEYCLREWSVRVVMQEEMPAAPVPGIEVER